MALVNQPGRRFHRKVLAAFVAGAIVGGINAALQVIWPDHPFVGILAEGEGLIQLLVMTLTGYVVKARSSDE